ncbi:MAG: type II toxin-antitoxin system VapC family toxin [Nitrospirota bacterium]|nr:type II toxin-antitoxin system VapC family toxin [Nitrospirota bacterium]
MKFWDASAIIPLCFQEPRTAILRKLTEEDGALAAWWATPVECYSALARLRREGILNSDEEAQAREVVHALMSQWTEVAPSSDVRESAGRALLLHSLRAADSLQLAAALVWARRQPGGHHFVCLDQRLREAAQCEGFVILPKRL